MNRLKFLVFTLVTVGLWLAGGAMSAPAAAARLVEQGAVSAARAPSEVALALESMRSALQAGLLAADGPARWNVGPKAGLKPEAPNAERLNAVRAAVGAGLTDAQRAALVVVLVNDVGSLAAQGAGDGAAVPEGVDAKALAQAGAKGVVAEAFGAAHLFLSAPLTASDKNEVKSVGAAVVGLPVAAELSAAMDRAVKAGGVSALGLVADGKVVASAGPKDKVQAALKLRSGAAEVLERGMAMALGPLGLPHFTSGDAMGGQAALSVAARQSLEGTPFDVVAVVSLESAMQALAGGQKTMLMFLVAVLALGLVFTALAGGASEDDDVGMSVPAKPSSPASPVAVTRPEPALAPPAALPLAEPAPAAEASPDDFQFGSAPLTPPPSAPEPTSPGFTSPHSPAAADPFSDFGAAPPVPLPGPASTLGDEEHQATTAYPMARPPVPFEATERAGQAFDPFSAAGGGPASSVDEESATRVSAIPEELLRASARNTGEVTAVNPAQQSATAKVGVAAPVAPVAAPTAVSEEAHFQDVFKEFVTTRERCGEPSDGLTFEKFAAKLRKNKDQLVAKYACKTVRFQVYVKDGKAALKATPVKD
ncbi:MAG: hypothetical protein K1X89_05605 [Myxococcaceae bacterium]|nr:hypothetical protein [Myxococcaceae bacterium]